MFSWIRTGRKGKTIPGAELTDLQGDPMGPSGNLAFTFIMTGILSGTHLEVQRDVDRYIGWIDLDEVAEFESDVKRVRCIDDSYVGNLQKGAVYQVEAETRYNHYIIDGRGLLKHRFEVLTDEDLPEAPQASTSVGPVNDHTCSQCGNTRCSKTERSCWRCGAVISG